MKTAVIYARYSSDAQTEQSIEGQLRVCQEYAKNNNILIVDTYIDRAMTGTNDNRAAFQKMLKDSSNGQFSLVLVYKLDRFSRNKFESVVHKKTLKDNGVTVLSAMENISDTPEGRMLESILESFNQYFSEELTQKVNRGLRESWMKGNATGGQGYYGYDVVDKRYVINESEAEVVRFIFEKYSQGFVAQSIADTLKERGVRRKNGRLLNRKYLYQMLHNIRYTGTVYHKGERYDNIFPRIVPDDVWQKVCAINEDNKHAPSRKKDIYDFILSGKLVCGDCKRKMSGESGTSQTKHIHYYYLCTSRRKKKAPCKTKAIRKQYLEDLVITATMTLLKENSNLEVIADKIFEIHQTEIVDNTTLNLLIQKRNEAEKASKNLVKAIEQGIIFEHTKTRLAELEKELLELDFSIEQEKQRNYVYLTKEDILSYLQQYLFKNPEDISVRKIIVNTFIREIVLYEDHLLITYNFDESAERVTINPSHIREVEQQLESNTPAALTLPISSTIVLAGAPTRQTQ